MADEDAGSESVVSTDSLSWVDRREDFDGGTTSDGSQSSGATNLGEEPTGEGSDDGDGESLSAGAGPSEAHTLLCEHVSLSRFVATSLDPGMSKEGHYRVRKLGEGVFMAVRVALEYSTCHEPGLLFFVKDCLIMYESCKS